MADEGLGLALVRRDEIRLGLDCEAKRFPLGVDDRQELAAVQLADELTIEARVDRAGSDPASTTNSARCAR